MSAAEDLRRAAGCPEAEAGRLAEPVAGSRMEAAEESSPPPDTPETMEKYIPRSEKSLTLLTTRFVHLLQEADNGELDLRDAIRSLNVAKKRRIYDITNVLEGIGLIVKTSKRMVKWVGSFSDGRLAKLQSEVKELRLMEHVLDQQRMWVEQSIANTREDCSGLTYVNNEDICNCFSGHTVLAVQAPPDTQLDVPIPKAVQNSPPVYQVHLKSVRGPMDVVFMNKACVGSVPVILPIPPPEEILQRAKLAMLALEETDRIPGPCHTSASTTQNCKSEWMAMRDRQLLHKSSFNSAEPNKTAQSALHEISKELQGRLDTPKDLLTRFIASEVFSPLLRLSSSPSEQYACNLDESEGVPDLFDVPALSV